MEDCEDEGFDAEFSGFENSSKVIEALKAGHL